MKKIKFLFLFVIFGIIALILTYFWLCKNQKNSENFSGNIVQIQVIQNEKIYSGMGYKYENFVLTASHVVPENSEIWIDGEKFFVIEKNDEFDMAYLSKNLQNSIQKIVFSPVEIGENVHIFVKRGKSIIKKGGKIIAKNQTLNAFFQNGKITQIKNTILTDIETKIGDSGTPILNENHEIVGIIHTENK